MTNTQETVNTILIDVLKGVKETGSELYAAGKTGVAQAVDFALQQAPLVVQEFLSWKMSEAIINLIFFGIGTVIMLFCLVFLLKKAKKNIENDAIVPIFFGTLFTVITLIALLNNIKKDIQTIVKIKLAPRVYIIEYVTGKK
jgi:FtsH-binding integral membrane protein